MIPRQSVVGPPRPANGRLSADVHAEVYAGRQELVRRAGDPQVLVPAVVLDRALLGAALRHWLTGGA
jgi:hypothetical protein